MEAAGLEVNCDCHMLSHQHIYIAQLLQRLFVKRDLGNYDLQRLWVMKMARIVAVRKPPSVFKILGP